MELLEADGLARSFILKEGPVFRKSPKTVNADNREVCPDTGHYWNTLGDNPIICNSQI